VGTHFSAGPIARKPTLGTGSRRISGMLRVLRLRDFRPFLDAVFDPVAGDNFIVGPNAQGKTSILEAACLLLRLQSPRAAALGECVRFGTPGFAIDGRWDDRHLHLKFEGRLKRFSLDSKEQVAAVEYLSVARVAWISNGDLDLVTGPGSARRRYLDFSGVQLVAGYLKSLRSYERALRSRNALLRDGRPRREVEAFDGPLSTAGDFLLNARARLCEELAPLAEASSRSISGGGEPLGFGYLPGARTGMSAALSAAMEEDIRLRTTTVGPHRDEVTLTLSGRSAATYASEGQQRSTALGLKLAQADHIAQTSGSPPLYLIDDVFGELDPVRRNNLLAALPAGAQKLITATSLDWADGLHRNGALFQIEGGGLRRVA